MAAWQKFETVGSGRRCVVCESRHVAEIGLQRLNCVLGGVRPLLTSSDHVAGLLPQSRSD